MSEWLSKYWFSIAGACVVVAVTAYRLSHAQGRSGSDPAIWRGPSVSISLLLAALPISLFIVGAHEARHAELVLQTISCLFISLLFLSASRFRECIALSAFLCWLSTSSVRPTQALWTRVYGILFLVVAAAAYFSSGSNA